MSNNQKAWIIKDEGKLKANSQYVGQELVTTDPTLAELLFNLHTPDGVFMAGMSIPEQFGRRSIVCAGDKGGSCMATALNFVPPRFAFQTGAKRPCEHLMLRVVENRLHVDEATYELLEFVPAQNLDVLNMDESEEQLKQYIDGSLEFLFRGKAGYTYGRITKTILTYIKAWKRAKELNQ